MKTITQAKLSRQPNHRKESSCHADGVQAGTIDMHNILYIMWNDDNKLGIPIIDEQHRGVVSTINSLHYFIFSGRGNEIIKPIIIMLEQYTAVHFKTEEELMTKAKYPALQEHIVLHKKFTKETRKFSYDIKSDQDSHLVLKFLKEWWMQHIKIEDRKYLPFLINLV